jgi:hypothetical protein
MLQSATVRKNTWIDWTVKDNVRAKLRAMVKRILRTYAYPPDKQERTTLTVLQQAELLFKDWAASCRRSGAVIRHNSSTAGTSSM